MICLAYAHDPTKQVSKNVMEFQIVQTFYSPLASWASPYFSGLDLAIVGLAHILQALI